MNEELIVLESMSAAYDFMVALEEVHHDAKSLKVDLKGPLKALKKEIEAAVISKQYDDANHKCDMMLSMIDEYKDKIKNIAKTQSPDDVIRGKKSNFWKEVGKSALLGASYTMMTSTRHRDNRDYGDNPELHAIANSYDSYIKWAVTKKKAIAYLAEKNK